MKTKIIGKATLYINGTNIYESSREGTTVEAMCLVKTDDGAFHNNMVIPLPLAVFQYIQDNQHIIGHTITIQFVDELKKETVNVK